MEAKSGNQIESAKQSYKKSSKQILVNGKERKTRKMGVQITFSSLGVTSS